jgi:MFS family permease
LGNTSTLAAADVKAHRARLFLASCVALIATAMTFAVRGDTIGALKGTFDLSDPQVGWIMSGAFWGFTLSIFIGGQLCDLIGMGRIMFLAFAAHAIGTFVIMFADGFTMLAVGTLAIGIANGFVEAAINPLVATVYADKKTHMLNLLHAWFPGGIVIGSLVCVALAKFSVFGLVPWQWKFASVLLPTIVYGILFLGLKLPATERVQSGVSTKAMYGEVLRPLFLVWLFCMLCTAATELGTNQWIGEIMGKVTAKSNVPGILVLAWISIVMCFGRLGVGSFVHRVSPMVVLIGSAVFAAIGLFALSRVTTAAQAFGASFIFAVGVCYFWPTMLGVTSERFPKGGALLLGLMGGAGMLSSAFAQPLMGKLYEDYGANGALEKVILLPVMLIVVFTIIHLRDKAKGGYKAVKLTAEAAPEKTEVKV